MEPLGWMRHFPHHALGFTFLSHGFPLSTFAFNTSKCGNTGAIAQPERAWLVGVLVLLTVSGYFS